MMEKTGVRPQKMFFDSGNELAAYAAKQINYHVMGYYPITPSTQIAENLDDYLLEPDQRTPEEVAIEELRFIVDEHSRSILQKHVVLYNYGQDVMAAHNALLTPYGLVQRRDGEPIRNEETQAENAGMEMM